MKLRFHQSKNHKCLNIVIQDETDLLLIPDNISIEEKLINVLHVSVNFYDKSKFENKTIRKSMNGLYLIFTNMENKHRNLHHILDDYDDDDNDDDDDDDDDDGLNTHNLFT